MLKIYAALCIEQRDNLWNVEVELVGKTREEIEIATETMLTRCVNIYDGTNKIWYEKHNDSEYLYILFEELNESHDKEIVYRYKIVEFNV